MHLASFRANTEKENDYENIIDSNIKFPLKILRLMYKNNINKFINIGSYWSYGEKNKPYPNTIYSASKKAFLSMIDYYVFLKFIHSYSLILFDVYDIKNKNKIFYKIEKI